MCSHENAIEYIIIIIYIFAPFFVSRTLFIVNLHPAAVHYHESVMSCLYGQRAKRIKNLVGKNDDASAVNARFGTLQAQVRRLV